MPVGEKIRLEVKRMKAYQTLHELIEKDPRSKALYEGFDPDTQVALQELRQDVHSYEELKALADGFAKQKNG